MDKTENNEELDPMELTPNECELYDYLINEYNDLFENILNLKGKNIYAIIKRNVFLLLGKKEFNKYSKTSMKKVYNKIKEDYFQPDNIVIKNLEDNLDSIGVRDLPILNIDSIFAHCKKCYECTHICGEPLYNYKYYDLIICLKCKMIYKKNMIRLFCTSCNEEYYSYTVSENNYKEDFFPATWEQYHCFTYNYDQIPCPECLSPLYYSEVKKLLKCFKCNWTSNPSTIQWVCEICGNNFTSRIKEFVKFETKPEINCIKYALINRIHARPFKCKCCGINPININFFHVGCGGTYFLSYLQTKIAIVCNKCKTIQNPEKIEWGCSNCKESFSCDKIIILENNFDKNVLQTRTNFFLKDTKNKKIKSNIKKEIRVSSNERCLTSKKIKKIKENDTLKDYKSHKIKIKQRNIKNDDPNENGLENKNIKRNLEKSLKTIDTSGNIIDSNLFNKNKNFNMKRKDNLSNTSLEFYVVEKNSTKEKTDNEKDIKKEKEKDKENGKEDKKEIIKKEKNNIKEDNKEEKKINKENKESKKEVISEKEKKKEKENKKLDTNREKSKNIYSNNNIKEDKNKNENESKENNKTNNKLKEKKLKKEKTNTGKKLKEKRKQMEIKEQKEEKVIISNNNSIKEIIEIKETNKPKEEQNNSKLNNNEAKYNRRQNYNIIIDKANIKGQSQKKSKNIRLNVNLNININNILDNKHNNNSIHSIKHIRSLKTLTTKQPLNIEPDKHFNPDEFKIIEKIGYGSFGKIYKVKWIRNNENYAMKILNLKYIEDIEDTQKKLQIVQDFCNKTKCNGIIKTYGSLYEKTGIEEYKYYILMELAQTDWEEEIKYRNKHNLYYSEEDIFNMIQQLVQCYALLQKNNVSHRDVKPQNILLLNGMYKVCDFGEARIISGKNGYIHQPIRGSELYMSPILFDALNNHRLDVLHNSYKSDVFSLGMCIFFAATLSFDSLYDIREEKNMKIIKKILEKYLIPHYSTFLVNILYQMLQVDEDLRPNFIELEKFILYSKQKD